MSDIVDRLRTASAMNGDTGIRWEAADEIERLRAALKPFAKGFWAKQSPDVTVSVIFNYNPFDERPFCKVGDIHRAVALIEQKEAKRKELLTPLVAK